MLLSLQRAILKTILYGDIFDYPLTMEEIKTWLIGTKNKKQIPDDTVKKIKNIHGKDGYYFLKGRDEIVDLRTERNKWSQDKFKKAQEIADLLKFIPTIKLAGITGALAVDNTKKQDDVDLFIVTSHGLLWTTRLVSTLVVEITGNRRHPGETQVDNKICLNMFADENYLEIPGKEQDLFSAHEVLQMKLLWDRDRSYHKFLLANRWVDKYLPNAINSSKYQVVSSKEKNDKSISNLLKPFENFLKSIQLWYMKSRRTTEIISEGVLRFHPQDARVWVMKKYKQRLKEFNL